MSLAVIVTLLGLLWVVLTIGTFTVLAIAARHAPIYLEEPHYDDEYDEYR